MNGYGDWEQTLLANLEAGGGAGAHTAEYLRRNNTALITVDNDATNLWWKPKMGRGLLHLENALYLSKYLRDKPADSPWLLSSIVHETRHLEQGFWTAFSVYGEMEAWQLGFNFYDTLPGHHKISQPVRDLLALPLSHNKSTLREAARLINLDQNGGTTLKSQVLSLLKDKKKYHGTYWILVLPLNPLFS